MDIRHLHYFIEVAKQQSFSKAAEALHISQPTVSKMIRNLEGEIGAPLLHRSVHSFQLTDVGEIVYAKGQQILQSFVDLAAEIADIKNVRKGQIKIGVPPMIGAHFFPKLLSSFHDAYPQISIKLIEDGAKNMEKAVINGDLDLAAVVLPVDPAVFEFYPFYQEDLRLVVHPNHPLATRAEISLPELREEAFILFREGFTLHYVIRDECRKAGFTPTVVCESSQWDFISEMVAANLGISLLPDAICRKLNPAQIATVPLVNPAIHWNLAIIWLKGKYLSHASREWLQFMQDFLEQQRQT
ncbi:LysR family transcriptional regulator [Brevibacillus fulvus]|uniref:DNA-binding transcriptional LysR family regulator n=1 Tax=Brevibacillus fulvus TaxID=1125967 RepID=A0A938Y299_9BACL|nr:LysR family transcriptional regulator [Brevibacillus fulvus]MBM7591995.1 DNA-binding transcriptional LysR family regulator [Brevibacillus fulvus]